MHGQFVWYELMTADSAGAQRFYPPITGWGTEKWDAPNTDYGMWTAAGQAFAGIIQLTATQRSQGMQPQWLAYVAVDNVDMTLAKATSLGAKITVPAMDVPDVGRMAVIQDPQGATIAVYRASSPRPGYDGTPKLGTPSWHELCTVDYKAALSFYSALFGWQKIAEEDVGGGMLYLTFGINGKQYGGMFNRNPQWNQPVSWTCYMTVRDVNASAGAIKRGGGKVTNGPMEVPGGGWIANAADPQGTSFAVFQAPAGAMQPAKKSGTAKKKAKAKPKKKAKAKKVKAKKKSKVTAKKKSKGKKKAKKRR